MAWMTVQLELAEAGYRQLVPLLTRLSPDGLQVEDGDTLGGPPVAAGAVRVTLFVSPERIESVDARLRSALAHVGAPPPLAVAPLHERDWNAAWRAHFKPLDLGRHLRVEPKWDRDPTEGDRRALVLDPGLAFGTGTHETTQLVCGLMEDWVDAAVASGREVGAVELLDVGTGSAILSMAAIRLGLGHATGTEVDPNALDNARAHLALNGLQSRVTLLELADPDALAPRRWELVVANIISGTLLRLRDALVARTRPGGTLLISGVLQEEGAAFLGAFAGRDLVLRRQRRRGEWLGFVFGRPP